MKEKDLMVTANAVGQFNADEMYGFEDSRVEDIILPRIKVINALSPERIEGEASEGDILNSLTKDLVAGKRFIPIKQFYSNIRWNPDRNADIRIFCRSNDGNIGQCDEGSLACAQCKKNQFDNTKTGKDAQPLCTSYLNFIGFFEGNPMPAVLSFSRTNYNEGRKMLSIAKTLRAAIWNYAYTLSSKKVTKDRNTWFILVPQLADETTPEERKLAFEIYTSLKGTSFMTDYEEPVYADETNKEVEAEIADEI